MNKLNQFKHFILSLTDDVEMQIYLEDMFNCNLKDTSAFTMMFDTHTFLKELEQTNPSWHALALKWLNRQPLIVTHLKGKTQ